MKKLYRLFKRALYIFVNEGFKGVLKRIHFRVCKDAIYADWLARNEIQEVNHGELESLINSNIKISLITPVYRPNIKILMETIDSVFAQAYPNWELCLALAEVDRKCLAWLQSLKDPRIKLIDLQGNHGIAQNTNLVIKEATGSHVGFLDHDDILPPHSLFEMVKAIRDQDPDIIYSDEDKLNDKGNRRFSPYFKPNFSPELLLSMNYICHFVVVKRAFGDSIGWLSLGYDGAQDHEFLIRASKHTSKFYHIPKILYHWRAVATSSLTVSGAKHYAHDAGLKAVQDHLARTTQKPFKVEEGPGQFRYKVTYDNSDELVSIIIPNKDQYSLLSKCISSIYEKTTHKKFEIIIIENNSTTKEIFDYYEFLKSEHENLKVLTWEHEFNYSDINNFAAKEAKGTHLLFLNNDIEVISTDWIERMLDYSCLEDIGAVGAKLFYPDMTIQHAGVVIGIGGIAGHGHKGYPSDSYGYNDRLSVPHDVSAVTGACLMVKKSAFFDVQGFTSQLKVAFNDVDLCLKLVTTGKRNVFTPYSQLIHYESKTRGYEDTPEKAKRFENECLFMLERWKDFLKNGDPFYNCNLTLSREDFSLK
jgi:O-antigen biosynthesis protein